MVKTEREEELRRIQQEKLEEAKQKLYWSEAGVRHLVSGIIGIFSIVILIIFAYGYISGMASTGDIGIKREGINALFVIMFLVLLIGVASGFEIGRYVQTEFTKRRRQRQPQPPPPPP